MSPVATITVCITLLAGRKVYGIGRSQLITISHRPHSQVGSLPSPNDRLSEAKASTFEPAQSRLDGEALALRATATDSGEAAAFGAP